MSPPRGSPIRPRRAAKPANTFNPRAFLASAGFGKSVYRYSPKGAIFSQGQRADAVFYIQAGRVKLCVLSKQGKEATIALLGRATSLEKDASPPTNRSVCQPLRPLQTARF